MNIREICKFAREALGKEGSQFFSLSTLGEAQRLAAVFAIVTAIDQYRQMVKAAGQGTQTADSERRLNLYRNAVAHSTNLSTMLASPETLWNECQSHLATIENLLDKKEVVTSNAVALETGWLAQPSQKVRLTESVTLMENVKLMMAVHSTSNDRAGNLSLSLSEQEQLYLKAAIIFQLCTLGQLQFKDSLDPRGHHIRTQALISFKSYLSTSDLATVEYFQQHRDKAYHSKHINIEMFIRGTFNLLMHDELVAKLDAFSGAIDSYYGKSENNFLSKRFAALQDASSEDVIKHYQASIAELEVIRKMVIERGRDNILFRNAPFDQAIMILQKHLKLIEVAVARRDAGEAEVTIPVLVSVQQLYPIYICFFLIQAMFYSENLAGFIEFCPCKMESLPTDNPFHMPLTIAMAYGADVNIVSSLIDKKHPYDFHIKDKYRDSLPSGYSFVHLIYRMSMQFNFDDRLSAQAEQNICYLLTLPQESIWAERIPILHTAVQLNASMALVEHLVDLGFDLNKRVSITIDKVKIVVPIWMESFNNLLVGGVDEELSPEKLAMSELVFRFPSVDFSLQHQLGSRRGSILDHLCKFTTIAREIRIDYAGVRLINKTIPAAVLEKFLAHCPEDVLKKLLNEENSEGNTPITLGVNNAKYRMTSPTEQFFYGEALKRMEILSKYQLTNLSVCYTADECEMTADVFTMSKKVSRDFGWPIRFKYHHKQNKYFNTDALSSVVFDNNNADVLGVLFDVAKSRSLLLLRALLMPLNVSKLIVSKSIFIGGIDDILLLVQKAQTIVTEWQAALAVIADANTQIPKLCAFTDGRAVTDVVKIQFDAKITEKEQARDKAMAQIEQFQSIPIDALVLTLRPLEENIPPRNLHEAMLISELQAVEFSDETRVPALRTTS